MNYQKALQAVANRLQRVTRTCWNESSQPYARMAYLVNAYYLVMELRKWMPEDVARIPRDLTLKIEDRAGTFDLRQYEPEPEDLTAEDWELYTPPEHFANSDLCHEHIFPYDLWPEEEED